jgi:hypothetical protein
VVELATPATDDYAPLNRPVEEILTELVKKMGEGRKPALVYLFDGRKKDVNFLVEETYRDEKICIALEHFLCLKADLGSVTDRRQREKLMDQAPILMFFAPDGRSLQAITGRRAASRKTLSQQVGKLWTRTFTISLRNYLRRKDGILDRRESLERKREILLLRAERARDKPAKLAPLERDIAAVEKLLREVRADEEKLNETVKLRKPLDEPDRSG